MPVPTGGHHTGGDAGMKLAHGLPLVLLEPGRALQCQSLGMGKQVCGTRTGPMLRG